MGLGDGGWCCCQRDAQYDWKCSCFMFPVQVLKPYKDSLEVRGKKEASGPQPAAPLPFGEPGTTLPREHPQPGLPGTQPAPHAALPTYSTHLQGPAGSYTTVTATASVTVALHPTLPGSYPNFSPEGFTSSERDCLDEPSISGTAVPNTFEMQNMGHHRADTRR